MKAKNYLIKKPRLLLIAGLLLLSNLILATPLSGTYSIGHGSGYSYNSIQAAFSDLDANGINGPVVLMLAHGVYTEQITLDDIAGTSETNTITLRPLNSMQRPIIQYSTAAYDDGIFNLTGIDHLKIYGIRFNLLSTSGCFIYMHPTASINYNVEFNNCYFVCSSVTNSTYGIKTQGKNTSTLTVPAAYNTVVRDCRFKNLLYGVYFYGITQAPGYNNKVVNCRMDGCSRAITISRQKQATIKHCYLGGNDVLVGISATYCADSKIIRNEIISNGQSLYMQYENKYNHSTGDTSVLRNNLITHTGYNYAVSIYYTNYYQIIHNSVLTTSATPGRFALYMNNCYGDGVIVNNVFDSYYSCVNLSFYSAVPVIDYNNYQGSEFYWNYTKYTSFSRWKNGVSTANNNSIAIDPQFVSTNSTSPNLRLGGTNLANKGDDSYGISTDIDGDARPRGGSKPDIGADEISEDYQQWLGSTSTWMQGANWGGGLPGSGADVYVGGSAANDPSVDANISLGNLEVGGGAEVEVQSGYTLTLDENFINNSGDTLDIGAGKIAFAGSSKQWINKPIIAHIKVDNSSDLGIQDQMYFKSVEFTNGDIDLGDNDVYLSGTSTGAGANSYFKISGDGTLNSYLNANAKTFDVGFNPYLPVTIECPDCDGSELFEVSVADLAYQNPETSQNQVSNNIVTNTWKITTNATHDVTITFQWNSSDEENLGTAINLSQWQEGIDNSWNTGGVTTKTGSGPYTITQTINGMDGSYFFVVGNQSTVLPVELTHFNANWVEEGKTVQLSWETAQELNNSHFEIERSFNGEEWSQIGIVEGNGTTELVQSYHFTDHGVSSFDHGLSTVFYRLKQVDYNGEFEYSPVRTLFVNEQRRTQTLNLSFYPNPAKDKIIVSQPVQVKVYNLQGVLLLNEFASQNLDLTTLASGQYIVELTAGSYTQHHKLIID
ncbi:MAG: T9SS type A sorting domain-containing protein [Bacteroidetes bacterium]|nr:T9SS type A sorting domain-containing protein [Bacteroidota bacterium]